MARTFEDRPATREATPIMVGLVGPGGSGKTMSALRLAAGIQSVSGGDIYAIDTESRRMLHYADKFSFRHLPFGAPFSPLNYWSAIEHCLAKGAKTIIVDSMSHEHEGPGGVLEMHERELDRLCTGGKSRDKMTMLAWAKPKQERRRMINNILQANANFIFCFRAKEKLRLPKKGDAEREPTPLGYMPQAGEEFVYEMTVNCLLLPGSMGVPTWQSEMPGERGMMKLPEQFRGIFSKSPQLTEDIGRQLAEWSKGSPSAHAVDVSDLLARFVACADPATLRALKEETKAAWPRLSADARAQVGDAGKAAAARLEPGQTTTQPVEPEPQEGATAF